MILNPLTLIHCVLYIVVLSILLWRVPRARRGSRHIGYSGLAALATGLPLVLLTLPNWGLDVYWVETPLAIFSTIMFTVVSFVVPAGLHGWRTLKRRSARAARARRGP